MAKPTLRGGVRPLDVLAMDLESGAISRGKAIKLGGAALVASALGMFSAEEAAEARTRCCRHRRRPRCRVCCRRRRLEPCCGVHGCHCCPRGTCAGNGFCFRR
jgi:hypothetical protein